MSKKALGRGLDALINTDEAAAEEGQSVVELSTALIDSADSQPRKLFSEDTLVELAASIRENGVIQPIIVEKSGDRYRVIAGERRLRAVRLTGIEKIPAIIREYPRERLLQVALIENIQRENLNPIDEANAFDTLLKQTRLSQEELAERIGKSRPAIANSLRLLKLPQEIQEAVANGKISSGHARAILSLSGAADQQRLYAKIVEAGLSVREAEKLAGEAVAPEPSGKEMQAIRKGQKDPEIRELEQRLLELFGTKVELKGSLRKGKIEVSYYSQDDLERLIDLLLGEGT